MKKGGSQVSARHCDHGHGDSGDSEVDIIRSCVNLYYATSFINCMVLH